MNTDRIYKLVQWIREEDPDVCLLQEIFLVRVGPFCYGRELYLLVEELQRIGYSCFSNPQDSLPTLFGQNSGLLIASKIPFDFSDKVYSITKEINNKGFTGGRFSLGEQELYIITTHLSKKSWTVQEQQVEELFQYLNR
eukprot:UN24166